MHDEWLATTSAAVFSSCSAVLCLEMCGFAVATATLRQARNVWLNEEDAKRFAGTVADFEDRDVARLLRVHRNQIENCVPFFVLGFLWVLSGIGGSLAVALFLAFTVSRALHPVFYLTGRGRLRTASFTVSFVVNVILACGLLIHASRAVLGVLDERGEDSVEVRAQPALHCDAVEEPPERPELDPILELLGDSRTPLKRLDPRDPSHEVDGPVAFRDLEPERPAVLPVGDAFDHATLREELADA